MKVLGLETSCDETALAIYDDTCSTNGGIRAAVLHSQIALHANYGGVVPELASRDHIRKLIPLLNELLADAKLSLSDIDAIAYTKGPGLVGALMTGAVFGRTLAYRLNIPALGVHHLEGHLLAPFLDDTQSLTFPFVCLLVSGGHTMLVHAKALGDYTILGQSIDDAAGECFDKAAKMLNLPYPGGPNIATLAQKGDKNAYDLPRPMLHKGLDFSFSGMKTAVHNLIKDTKNSQTCEKVRADIAASFEWAMVDTLTKKCLRALSQTNLDTLIIAGGVSANQHLRTHMVKTLANKHKKVYYAPKHLCTDNGAMIAYAGYCRLKSGCSDDLALQCHPRWDLQSLAPL